MPNPKTTAEKTEQASALIQEPVVTGIQANSFLFQTDEPEYRLETEEDKEDENPEESKRDGTAIMSLKSLKNISMDDSRRDSFIYDWRKNLK